MSADTQAFETLKLHIFDHIKAPALTTFLWPSSVNMSSPVYVFHTFVKSVVRRAKRRVIDVEEDVWDTAARETGMQRSHVRGVATPWTS